MLHHLRSHRPTPTFRHPPALSPFIPTLQATSHEILRPLRPPAPSFAQLAVLELRACLRPPTPLPHPHPRLGCLAAARPHRPARRPHRAARRVGQRSIQDGRCVPGRRRRAQNQPHLLEVEEPEVRLRGSAGSLGPFSVFHGT